jgi:chaperonin GroEL (HSP60 family)
MEWVPCLLQEPCRVVVSSLHMHSPFSAHSPLPCPPHSGSHSPLHPPPTPSLSPPSDPKILLLNIELELKAEKENAEIRLDDPAKYQSIVDAEWNIIYDKLARCVESGANIVLSRLAIGDLGTQYFADRGVFCAGRVAEDDLQRVAKATGERVTAAVTQGERGRGGRGAAAVVG